jgi:hypothetical protein
MTARPAAQIEYRCTLPGMDECQNLLGFVHGALKGAQLGEEQALQVLPEGVVVKPGRHA